MSVIAGWLNVSLPSVTGTVERLERHGLVERRHSAGDRRVVEVHLTDRGRDLRDEMVGLRLGAIRTAFGVLDAAELADLTRLLQAITQRTERATR